MVNKTNGSTPATKSGKNSAATPTDLFFEALRDFASAIKEKFSASVRGEPEDQIRAPFETLIGTLSSNLNQDINVIGETLLKDRVGRPDYGVALNRVLCGYVELKAPGKGADPTKYKGHDKLQWERFKGLPNLVYGDGQHWSLYRSGVFVRTASLTGNPCSSGRESVEQQNAVDLFKLFTDFLTWEPIVPRSAKQLAFYLAPLCRMLKDDVLDALKRGSLPILGVARDWRRYLFPDADNEKVADSYAQTVTFALLLARSEVAPFVRTFFSIFKWNAGRSRCRFYRGQHREVSFVRSLVRQT